MGWVITLEELADGARREACRRVSGRRQARSALDARFRDAGLDTAVAGEKAVLAAQCAEVLISDGAAPSSPAEVLFVPGRIEVLGKHTDYNGGGSIVAAPCRGFCAVATARDDKRVQMHDAAWNETVEFDLNPDIQPEAGGWRNYPMTAARRLARNFPGARTGASAAFVSDLPPAAGMSSSSALLVTAFLVLATVNRIGTCALYRENIRSPLDLADYLGTVENGRTFRELEGDRGVGTFGGSEDHTAMLCSRPGMLSHFTYCPVHLERRIPMPDGCIFALACSGVAAEKTGDAMAKYNRASTAAATAAGLWRQTTGRDDPRLADAIHSSADGATRIMRIIGDLPKNRPDRTELRNRVEHFIIENEQILPAAIEALDADDLAEFGRQVDASQHAAETLLANQVPETTFLAGRAREAGALAASAFGAGFGGSVWALVEEETAPNFIREWSSAYREAYPEHASRARFFTTRTGPPAVRLACDSPANSPGGLLK